MSPPFFCDILYYLHVYAKLYINSMYYLFIPLTINRYPRGTSHMHYMQLISFVHVLVHSLAPEACYICADFVRLTLCFKIVNPPEHNRLYLS